MILSDSLSLTARSVSSEGGGGRSNDGAYKWWTTDAPARSERVPELKIVAYRIAKAN